jgi:transcriptional regulator with XRE-family HTH domain
MLIAKDARRPRQPLNQDPLAVRQARRARGLTQADLAKQVETSVAHLSEIEGGTRNAKPELLDRIAAALDLPVQKLQRPRRMTCPACSQRYDPAANYLVPLHTLPESEQWCPAGGQPETGAVA